MNSALRFLGLLNVAIWLGGTVVCVVVAAPALTSADVQRLLGPANFPFFSGAMAQIVLQRWFGLQIACGIVALLLLMCQRLYSGRFHRKRTVALAVGLLALALADANVTVPQISEQHAVRYSSKSTPAQRDAATRSQRNWQLALQLSNLLTLSGLIVFFWQIDHPPEESRFVRSVKFRD